MQIEALKRYRTGGKQKVTVHHVSVNEGAARRSSSMSLTPGVRPQPQGRRRRPGRH
jgi:hypothetical protein